MAKLRCWPGCIARVNESANHAANVGALVEVVELAPADGFQLPGWPAGFIPDSRPRWVVRTVSRSLRAHSRFHGWHESDTGCVLDAALTPITPPTTNTTPAEMPCELVEG